MLIDCKSSQLLLQAQLLNKNAGQQLVQFSLTVNTKLIGALPNIIMQLIGIQSVVSITSPLIDAFNVIFTKLHCENFLAQLVDDGYQLSFELPLAIANNTNNADKVILDNTNVMLVSANTVLAELIEHTVLSAKGKFERLARIDSFRQQFTAKQLKRRKLELLVISSDIAVSYLDLITQQINALPLSLQPKLMVLQSKELEYLRDLFIFFSSKRPQTCELIFDFQQKETPPQPQHIWRRHAEQEPRGLPHD